MAAPQSAPSPASPSTSLLANLRQDLVRHPPFAQMAPQDVDFFITHAEQRYFAPDEVLVQPASGPVASIYCIRRGAVTGVRGLAELSGGAFQYEPGDLFPLSAALARRAVTATYRACVDTFALELPCQAMDELAGRSAAFADFMNRRVQGFLDLSRRALHVAYASQALAEQSLETRLGDLPQRPPVSCGPERPLREALQEMHQRRIGAMIVVDDQARPVGMLTRHDVLARVALAGVPLEQPLATVMVQPVHSLPHTATAQDAALLMSREGIRHVPVTRDGRLAGIVSERDLFAMQRLSLKQVSSSIRSAADLATLKLVARDIRQFARNLLSQGVQARQLTGLISHLNDVLAGRVVQLEAQRHGIDLARVCWLALGSEGREEQTVATDQDNALLLPDASTPAQVEAARAFGRAVNLALDACGYPLCRGGIMAGEPDGCLTFAQWRSRFADWIDHGAPHDLLQASIYFDLRPLAGDAALAHRLRGEVMQAARANPRFLKQLALNALTRGVPLNWLGGIDTGEAGTLDLKLQGTALFVDAARLYALAHGVDSANTRERLLGVGRQLGLASAEYEAWADAFEFLQMLRLRVQLDGGTAPAQPNLLVLGTLNDIDRRILKEAFRVARLLQQRMRLDYER